jgi:anti-sigma factor RsiW
MTAREQLPPGTHAEAAALPWYAAGVLTESEHRAIEAHLAGCAQCRAELDSLTQLRTGVHAALAAEPGPSPAVRLQVMARIRSAAPNKIHAPKPASSTGFLAQLTDWLRAPVVPRWAPAAALLLVVIQGGLLLRNTPQDARLVPVVTSRGLATQPTRLSVVFRPEASAAQIRNLLGSLDARIVDGPGPAGVYLVELPATDPAVLGQKIRAARTRTDVLQSLELAPP